MRLYLAWLSELADHFFLQLVTTWITFGFGSLRSFVILRSFFYLWKLATIIPIWKSQVSSSPLLVDFELFIRYVNYFLCTKLQQNSNSASAPILWSLLHLPLCSTLWLWNFCRFHFWTFVLPSIISSFEILKSRRVDSCRTQFRHHEMCRNHDRTQFSP